MPQGGSNVEFLRSSDIRVEVEHDIEGHIDRVIELINRTNQLNFTKRRLPEDRTAAEAEVRAMAAAAWRAYYPDGGRGYVSNDFRDGFLDGYADYLEFGGSGDPPSEPPRHYQRVRYQTPAGLRAIEDYYTGFHRGSAAAIASSQRQLLVVPMVVPATDANPVVEPNPAPPAAELLPAPR